MRNRIFVVMFCAVLILVFTVSSDCFAQARKAKPGPAADDFPSNRDLEMRNTALLMEGFMFTGGMRLNQKNEPNCAGLEIAPAKWNGSGFVVRNDGTIVTNYHVASKALKGTAKFPDGSAYEIANIKVYNADEDIAVMKISGQRQFPSAALGDSDRIEARDRVMAVGNPLGMGINITEGQVSQVVKDGRSSAQVIRHTAQIAPGNSGGALYRGAQVIGVNASVALAHGQLTGFNNAIPINKVKTLLSNPKYDRVIPLSKAFPVKAEEMLQISKEIKAVNGQVPAAAGNKPGTTVYVVELFQLEDIMLILTSPGRDLALSVIDAQGKLVACGDERSVGADALIFSNDFPRQVGVIVVNYDPKPANFGLNIRKIIW